MYKESFNWQQCWCCQKTDKTIGLHYQAKKGEVGFTTVDIRIDEAYSKVMNEHSFVSGM